MRIKSIEGVKTSNLFTVPLALLHEEPGFNERDYKDPEVVAQIRRFADAYKAGEYVPPLVIRNSGETIYIVEGHLRRRGALLACEEGAEIAGLSCSQFTGNDADRISFMVNASQGLPLNPVGRARAYLRLLNLGLSKAEIAAKVGHTETHVDQYLTFATANNDVQQSVKRGEVSFTEAVKLIREHGDAAGTVIAKTLAEVTAAAAERQAVRPSRPVRRLKVTAKAIKGGSADKPLVKAASKLLAPHVATLAKDGGEAANFIVTGVDLLALLNALPPAVAKRIRKSA